MALDATRMVDRGHLIHDDVKQFVDILTGVMADQPVTLANSLTIGGTTTLSGDPVLPLQAATKQYVDARASSLTWPLLAPNGSTVAPSYSFVTGPTTGLYAGATAAQVVLVATNELFLNSRNKNIIFTVGSPTWQIDYATGNLLAMNGNSFHQGIGDGTTAASPATVWATTFRASGSYIGPGSVPTGGATGQVLQKNTATNYDVGWTSPLTLPLSQSLTFSADNAYDLGTNGGNRPKDLNLAGNVYSAGSFSSFAGFVGISGQLAVNALASLNGGLGTGLWRANEVATPATPAGGVLNVYAKSDHKLYIKDSTGLETQLGAGGGGLTLPLSQDLTWSVDGGWNIGQVGASRPHNLYLQAGAYLAGLSPNDGYAFVDANHGLFYMGGNVLELREYVGVFNFRNVAASATATVVAEAANTLALRNGTANQALRVYGTYTDVNNYERGALWWSGPTLWLTTDARGTGTVRSLYLSAYEVHIGTSAAGADRWLFNSNGHLVATTDNAYDIGGLAPNIRPRNLYLAGDFQNAGRMGVMGGTDPSYALRVGGDMWMSGNLTVGGTITMGGPMTAQYYNATGGAFWGTGAADFQAGTNGGANWKILNASKEWQPQSDAGYDIGDGTHRVRSAYVGTSVVLGTAATPSLIRTPVNNANSLSIEVPSANNLFLAARSGVWVANNAYYDGSAWQRWDTTVGSQYVQILNGWNFQSVAAGTGAIGAWTTRLSVDLTGNLTVSGTVFTLAGATLTAIGGDLKGSAALITANGYVGFGPSVGGGGYPFIQGTSAGVLTVSGASLAAPTLTLTAALPGAPYITPRLTIYSDVSNWSYFSYGTDAQMRLVFSAAGGPGMSLGFSSANNGTGTFTPTMFLNSAARTSVGAGVTVAYATLHVLGSSNNTQNWTIANVTPSTINSPDGVLAVSDTYNGGGCGGTLLLGVSACIMLAGIRAIFLDGSNNGVGNLSFATRRNSADATLTEAFMIDSAGQCYPRGNLIVTGNITVQGRNVFLQGDQTRSIMSDGSNVLILASTGGAYLRGAATFVQTPAGVYNTISAAVFQVNSARAVKDNIVPLADPLGLILDDRLHGVHYTDKNTGKPRIGFVADDFEKVLPEVVGYEADGRLLGMSYGELTAVTWEALKLYVQRTNARIASLETQLAERSTS